MAIGVGGYDTDTDPFAAMGGGVRLPTGEWVMKDHPLASTPGATGGSAPPAPGAPGVSQPNPYSTNPDQQKQVVDSLMQRATQGTTVDTQDPQFRQQADSYHAQVERARRNYVADQAEKLGPYQTGALQGEERLASERAGQASAAFEADLVGRELQQRRDEIKDALQTMTGVITEDQRRQLQRELAQLDAALRREGLSATTALGSRELDIRDRLGSRGLEIDLIRALLQDKQFGQDLGFRIGATEADLSGQAMRYLLGV